MKYVNLIHLFVVQKKGFPIIPTDFFCTCYFVVLFDIQSASTLSSTWSQLSRELDANTANRANNSADRANSI